MNTTSPSPTRLVLWILAVAAIVGVGVTTTGASNWSAPPARVCVVDLEKVCDASPQRVTMEEALQQRDEEIKGLVAAAKQELTQLKLEMEELIPGSEEHQRVNRTLVQKRADLQFQSEQWEREMEKRIFDMRSSLIQEIETVVNRVCESEGFDIVFQREFKIPKTAVVWNTAFFARPEFDITERVITALK